ncbi:MAG: TonB-dependent receptor, partial [Pseudomonadota bacterium]|nr:TonB-dependent receptor [Pseudomonadota bacterium]
AQTVAAAAAPASPADTTVGEVVVTGSLFQHKLNETVAPVTVLTATDLTARGIATVEQGVQSIAANAGGSLPNSFTANAAFAAGAASIALRGLSSNSTLTLFDGLRLTYYPLADDGTRNFVDLNTIPDVIIDRIETLKDGASSTYGADAIAGVVNVITKHTYQGLTFKAEGGTTQASGGDDFNVQALVGHGDLHDDGYNVYFGFEYEHDSQLLNNQRGYPFNTSDNSKTCGPSTVTPGTTTCRSNGDANGVQFDGSFQGVGASIVPVVRPFDPVAGAFTGDYRLLNPAAGCGGLMPVTITPAQAAAGGASGIDNGPVKLCQQDLTHDYGVISPDDKRLSASFRGTKRLGENAEAYLALNFYRNDVFSLGTPSSIRQQATPGALGLPPYSTASEPAFPGLTLPVYICAGGVNCSAANGTLNPNNPFAAMGDTAKIVYRFGDIPASGEQISTTYRAAGGVKGSFDLAGEWNYDVEGTFSESRLTNIAKGDLFIANLLSAVADGSYNFVNPSANSQTVRNFISPENDQYSNSKLGQVQGTLNRDLFTLPGGPLQLGLIAAFRYESIFNPSANPDTNGPTERYFTINPFGAIGDRTTEAVAFELDAPVIKQLDLNFSGRYDWYSTGVSAFSPKVGGRFQPIKQITFRSTYSEGFRIPSFAEANSFPTTGFVNAVAPAAFQAAHGNDGYGNPYALGETTLANPNLKPETSRNFTVGIVVDPIPQFSLSFDYYHITKKNVIAADQSCLTPALDAYFNGTAPPPGGVCKIIPGIPDPNFPNALPAPGFIDFTFANLNSELTEGYDFGAIARFNLPYGVRYTSSVDGNYTERLDLAVADPNNPGHTLTQHYAGTIGPYNAVSASGTPKLRFNWQNTFSKGPLTLSATLYYSDGYELKADDFDVPTATCLNSVINATYLDGTIVECRVKAFWDLDAHASYDVNDHLQIYVDVMNVTDRAPPFDPTTYGANNYNPAWSNAGIYGRAFKIGAKVNF